MSQVFVNNGVSTLAANVAAADTTIFIQAGHVARFPTIAAPDYCFVTLENAAGALEIVKVTAHGAASASLTVVRGQQGTTALDWLTGDLVELRLTKDELNRFERAALRDGDTYSNTHDFLNATLKVKTPTTPFEAATKSFVESFLAAAAAAGAAGQLPNQAGKNGKYLRTNGTISTFENLSNGGVNTQSISSNLVLTADSEKYQQLSPQGPNLDITLPDATSLTTGFDVYKLRNTGTFGLGVCNNQNGLLGYLRAADETLLDLLGNGSAAGTWDVQLNRSPLDVADTVNTVGVSGTVAAATRYAKYRTAQLSATRGLQAYVSTAGNTTVVAVDLTTGAVGAPAAAQSDGAGTNLGYALFPLNATQALLVFSDKRMVVLTVAGDLSISFGTSVTLSATYGLFAPDAVGTTPNIIKLSPSLFLTIGGWSSPVQTVAISISGSVITQSVVSVSGISEGWQAYIGWVPLTATSALCTYTNATGNSSPYTNYTFVVTVSAGVQTHGTPITRSVSNQITAQPLLPYSSTKALQLINQAANVYARVLTISGSAVSAGTEQLVRSDASEGSLGGFSTLQSITNSNAYAYSAFAQDLGSYPIGGTYYASQSKAGVIDILNVNFAASTVSVATQAIATGTPVLTDSGYHLTFSYSANALTVGRVQLSATGATSLSSTVIQAKGATAFNYSIGKNYAYAVGSTPSGSSLSYSILVTDTGTLKASSNYSVTQPPLALKAVVEYPMQFTIGGRVWATQGPSNGTVSTARLI